MNRHTNPTSWVLLQYELLDAQEAIESLHKDMATKGEDVGEAEFRIHMAHIYGHINRAWHARNATDAQHADDRLWDDWNKFPTDLAPL